MDLTETPAYSTLSDKLIFWSVFLGQYIVPPVILYLLYTGKI